MAVISLTIPDVQLPRVLAALSTRGGYSATLPNGQPNPQTQAQFAKAQIILYVKEIVKQEEAKAAAAVNDIDVS